MLPLDITSADAWVTFLPSRSVRASTLISPGGNGAINETISDRIGCGEFSRRRIAVTAKQAASPPNAERPWDQFSPKLVVLLPLRSRAVKIEWMSNAGMLIRGSLGPKLLNYAYCNMLRPCELHAHPHYDLKPSSSTRGIN